MGRVYVNNFATSLNGAITDSTTSITINSSTGLPTLTGTQYYYLTIGGGGSNEIVKVTARTGTTLTIVRAQESTTAIAWGDGTPIEMRVTAGSHSIITSPTENNPAHWDTSLNLSANSHIDGFATTATAARTTTLTVTSAKIQVFTGVTTQNCALPVTSTLVQGQKFEVFNDSSGIVTVQSSGGNTVLAMAAGTRAIFTCILTSGTTAASWDYASFSSSGGGDVVGPASATSGAVALFDGTTGKLIKNGGATDALIHTITVGLGSGSVASNTAVGLGALSGGSLTGANNIGLGKAAGDAITSGADNICIGTDAGGTITTSTQNVLIGSTAGGVGTTGMSQRVVIGYQANGGAGSSGSTGSVFIGYQAGKESASSSTVGIGYQACLNNTNNLVTAIGYQALGDANATSQGAICIGYQAGMRVTASYPIYIGVSTGGTTGANVSGDYTIGIGYQTLGAATTVNKAVCVGGQAMTGVTTGSQNTGVGYGNGVIGPTGAVTLTTGTSNTLLGYRAGVDTNSAVGTIAIGADSVAIKSTGATSSDHGPGIAIGSAAFPVGFRGDATIYPSTTGGSGFMRQKINGTQYFVPLFADASTTILPAMAAQSDQETATSTTTIVTPGRQQYHPSAAKFWVHFTSITTTSITGSYNVSSLTDNGVGLTTVNYTTSFSDTTYCVTTGVRLGGGVIGVVNSSNATGSSSYQTFNTTFAAVDAIQFLTGFGDQ